MAAPLISKAELQSCVDAVQTHGSAVAAAAALSINLETFRSRMRNAKALGLVPRGMAPDHPRILKGKIKELQTELKKSLQTSSEVEAIKDAVGALRSNVEACEPPKWTQTALAKASSPGVPTLMLSDFHWGEQVFPAQIGGVNKFNMKIARERLRYTIDTAIHLCKIISPSMDYPGIVAPLGGDIISGNIHDELTATNELNTMPVVLEVYGELIAAITRLRGAFGSVFVPCVTGNHGRDTRKCWNKDRHHTSFDWLIYRFLAKHFEGDKRVTFYIPDGSDALYRVWDYKFLLSHGDQFRGGDSIIGCLGPLTRGNQKKRSRNQSIGMGYDTMIVGHFHTYIHTRTLIVNGSLKGMDEYAYTNNFSFEEPQQALWLNHPRHGITFRMPVNCEQGAVKAKTNWVSVYEQP
jgi:hypothetical protein